LPRIRDFSVGSRASRTRSGCAKATGDPSTGSTAKRARCAWWWSSPEEGCTDELSAAYLSQIETGKKPGSFEAMAKLARTLGVDLEDLERWQA
jgi:transcriptional regulator with XRE-family HTH domain